MNSKKVITILSIVLVLSLFAILVWALTVSTAVSNASLVSPVSSQNISRSLIFNLSAAAISDAGGNITNATISLANASNVSRQDVMMNISVVDTLITRNTSLSNATDRANPGLDLGGTIDTNDSNLNINDGYYNLTQIVSVNASDNAELNNLTVLKIPGTHTGITRGYLLVVDNTYPPAPVVNATNTSFYNFTTSGNNVSLQITATNITAGGDPSGTAIDRVTIEIQNLTYGYFNLTADPYSFSAKAEVWNLSFNQSNYTKDDGNYSFTVYVNDTAGNENTTTGWFIIDNNGPSVSVSCSPASPAVGDTILCTCTATDTVSGVQTKTFTGTAPSSSAAGSFTTSSCTAIDYARNSASATGSYTVSTAGSGGGSGGSGGGTSSSVQGQLEKKTWSSILAGEKATVAVKNGVLGVTSIEFVVQKTTYGATLSVKKVDSLPSTVEAFAQKAYKTLQITETNVEKALSGPAVISFKVEKKWLADNNLAASQVAMHHFKDGQWAELTTTAGQDDGTYVHFTAETLGFSYFVIGQKEGAAPVPAAAGTAAPAEQPTDVTEPSAPEEVSEPSSSSTAVWVVVGLVLLALVAWAVVSMKKRR